MNTYIKTIEDLSLNAWPSHQIEIYDGWLLRFSYFYTHRTNCVEQIGVSEISTNEKIRYCESCYKRWGTPAIFKITPLLDAGFDDLLADRGYQLQHKTHVMKLDAIPDYEIDPNIPTEVSSFISDSWIEGLFSLKSMTNIVHRQVVPSMYRAIPKDTICVSIKHGNRIMATGLGILDRDHVGIYAIHVHPSCRRKHYASQICKTILQEAKAKGAIHAYLQVVDKNEAAIRLYESLGLQYFYTYWFRSKDVFASE